MTTFRKKSNIGERYHNPSDLVSHQFQRFFQSYAMAFNRQQNRTGTLFERPFKRCAVNSEEKLVRLITYHHKNPQYHRLCSDFRKYEWTSYVRYLLDLPSRLPKEEVFGLFGDRQKFIEYHDQMKEGLDGAADWYLEE